MAQPPQVAISTAMHGTLRIPMLRMPRSRPQARLSASTSASGTPRFNLDLDTCIMHDANYHMEERPGCHVYYQQCPLM